MSLAALGHPHSGLASQEPSATHDPGGMLWLVLREASWTAPAVQEARVADTALPADLTASFKRWS